MWLHAMASGSDGGERGDGGDDRSTGLAQVVALRYLDDAVSIRVQSLQELVIVFSQLLLRLDSPMGIQVVDENIHDLRGRQGAGTKEEGSSGSREVNTHDEGCASDVAGPVCEWRRPGRWIRSRHGSHAVMGRCPGDEPLVSRGVVVL